MPRARKTLAEHKLAGTEPQYVTPEVSSFPAGGRPKMPKDLSPVAQAEWRRMVKQLSKRGTLTSVDAGALETYVCVYARWKKAALQAEENPTDEVSWTDANGGAHTKTVESIASKIAARLEISLRAYQKEFSATPASRERTKRVAQQPKKKNTRKARLAGGRKITRLSKPRKKPNV